MKDPAVQLPETGCGGRDNARKASAPDKFSGGIALIAYPANKEVRKMTQWKRQHLFSTIVLLLWCALSISAQSVPGTPGTKLPETDQTPISDQKAGSVLIYNYYTSDSNNPAYNTRISITNTHSIMNVRVMFYLVRNSCEVVPLNLSLTRNQTAVFRASDIDPDSTGYLLAMAVDSLDRPINFNFLTGDALVTSGNFNASLSAEAIGATVGTPGSAIVRSDPFSFSGTAVFGPGGQYGPLSYVLSITNFPSVADGETLLIVNGLTSGSILQGSGVSGIGGVFGLLYDDIEQQLTFFFNGSSCQLARVLSDSFPSTSPRMSIFIPSGRSGWIRFYSTSSQTRGLFGAVIYRYNNGSTGGHNLHKLTYTGPVSITVPISPVFLPASI